MNETAGSWGEYQRLVLAELERHNSLLQGIDTRIQSLKLEVELIKQNNERLSNIEAQVKNNTDKLRTIETGEATATAITKYRKTIVGGLFLIITALLIPTINLILHALGG